MDAGCVLAVPVEVDAVALVHAQFVGGGCIYDFLKSVGGREVEVAEGGGGVENLEDFEGFLLELEWDDFGFGWFLPEDFGGFLAGKVNNHSTICRTV